MRSKSIDELVIAAARGEPMDVAERERLDAALEASPELRRHEHAQNALSSELAALRCALNTLPASEGEPPDALRVAFSAAARAGARAPSENAPLGRARFAALGVAAAMLLAVGIWVGLRSASGSGGKPATTDAEAAVAGTARGGPGAQPPTASFVALPSAAGLPPSAGYSVIRVRIPVAAFALADFSGSGDATIDAQILVGEDGLARGIRFERSADLLGSNHDTAESEAQFGGQR